MATPVRIGVIISVGVVPIDVREEVPINVVVIEIIAAVDNGDLHPLAGVVVPHIYDIKVKLTCVCVTQPKLLSEKRICRYSQCYTPQCVYPTNLKGR